MAFTAALDLDALHALKAMVSATPRLSPFLLFPAEARVTVAAFLLVTALPNTDGAERHNADKQTTYDYATRGDHFFVTTGMATYKALLLFITKYSFY